MQVKSKQRLMLQPESINCSPIQHKIKYYTNNLLLLFLSISLINTIIRIPTASSFFPIHHNKNKHNNKKSQYDYHLNKKKVSSTKDYNNINSNSNNINEYQLEKSPTFLPKLQRQKLSKANTNNERVLVIGATGRIGRRVVKQLISQGISVRALVRDYDKAIEIFEEEDYDDDDNGDGTNAYAYANVQSSSNNNQKATLELIIDNFITSNVQNNNFEQNDDNDNDDDNDDNILFKAVDGCNTIISCVGSYRQSKMLNDYFPPWRIFQKNVSNWCNNYYDTSTHPYYVHYLFTQRLISCVQKHKLIEQEQQDDNKIKRSALSKYNNYDFDNEKDEDKNQDELTKYKIIRISDLNVAFKPYSIVSIITNIVRSMIFRYQYLSENLIRDSGIHYVILRPGDLVEEERDGETANLQIDPSGYLPSPSIVSCTDVAALAVATSTLSNTKTNVHDDRNYTLAIRWCSETLYPQKQGCKQDGYINATTCIQKLQTGIIQPKKLIPKVGKKVHYGLYVALFLYFWTSVFIRFGFMFCNYLFRSILLNKFSFI